MMPILTLQEVLNKFSGIKEENAFYSRKLTVIKSLNHRAIWEIYAKNKKQNPNIPQLGVTKFAWKMFELMEEAWRIHYDKKSRLISTFEHCSHLTRCCRTSLG
jgi:hypothetical protein